MDFHIHHSNDLDVRVLTSENTGTNHKLVLAQISYSLITIRQKHTEIAVKIKMELIVNETTKYLYH